MLSIQIDNPELEKSLKQVFGGNEDLISNAFVEFVQLQKVKQDVGISITQLDAGNAKSLKNVMKDIRSKYEE